MKSRPEKVIVINGMFVALVFLATYFIRFRGPISPGYINLGDAVIIAAALIYGKYGAMAAGALGSALADIAVPGGLIFTPVTFVVKGFEGYLAGAIAERSGENGNKERVWLTAAAAGAAVMVLGYFVAEATVLKLFNETFGLTAALAELPFNMVQGAAGAAGGYALARALEKTNVARYLK